MYSNLIFSEQHFKVGFGEVQVNPFLYSLRVPHKFGGMRDLAFFRCDIWDLSWKLGREVGIAIMSGSGISCFYGVGMWDSQGEQSGIQDFNSYVTTYIVIDQRKNHKLAEMNLLCI